MSMCKAPDIYIGIHSSVCSHVPPRVVKNLVETHAWGIYNVQFSTNRTRISKQIFFKHATDVYSN